ncbi:hypothetical protein AGLY_012823 [Aphis glycines]|uniref:Uncharacterized protein n=1 Tax=Aphis glycines TaxID=307491 RepID=A0A6G0T8U3_APHGL|nr:hypothetical protein AGLY_012823 [Aphis glycines]
MELSETFPLIFKIKFNNGNERCKACVKRKTARNNGKSYKNWQRSSHTLQKYVFFLTTEASSGDFSLVSFLREDFRFGFNFTPTSSEGSSSSFTTVSTFSIVRFLHQPYQISPELLRAFLLFLLFYFLLLRTTEASSGDFSLVSFLREDFRFGFNFTSISSEGCSSFTTVSTFSIVSSSAASSFFIDGFLLEKIFVLVLILLQPPLKALLLLLQRFQLFQLLAHLLILLSLLMVRFLHQPFQIFPELLRAFLLFLLLTTEASSGDFSLVSFLREDFRFGFNFTSISSEGCSSFTTVSTFSIVNSAAGPSFFIDGFLLGSIITSTVSDIS